MIGAKWIKAGFRVVMRECKKWYHVAVCTLDVRDAFWKCEEGILFDDN